MSNIQKSTFSTRLDGVLITDFKLGYCQETRNAPISVKPEGGGVGHRVGILTFSKKNYQNPHLQAKKNCQN